MRRAGILMPVSSLPSPWGIGTMGAAARETSSTRQRRSMFSRLYRGARAGMAIR